MIKINADFVISNDESFDSHQTVIRDGEAYIYEVAYGPNGEVLSETWRRVESMNSSPQEGDGQ